MYNNCNSRGKNEVKQKLIVTGTRLRRNRTRKTDKDGCTNWWHLSALFILQKVPYSACTVQYLSYSHSYPNYIEGVEWSVPRCSQPYRQWNTRRLREIWCMQMQFCTCRRRELLQRGEGNPMPHCSCVTHSCFTHWGNKKKDLKWWMKDSSIELRILLHNSNKKPSISD